MWDSRSDPGRATVVCIACGSSLPRAQAREYDKQGDRWDRHGKEFEHLCKECYRELTHQPREGLEDLLVAIEDESRDGDEFVSRYLRAVEEQRSAGDG